MLSLLKGVSGLSKEDLELLKTETAARKLLAQDFESVQDQRAVIKRKEASGEDFSNPDHIKDGAKLKAFFAEQGIKTDEISLKDGSSEEEGNFSEFSGITFEKLSLSGKFLYASQAFEPLRVDDRELHDIKPKFLTKILSQLWEEKLAARESEMKKQEIFSSLPTQTSDDARLKRRLLQDFLSVNDFTVELVNVTLMDDVKSLYQVNNVAYKSTTLSFLFNKDKNSASNVLIKLQGKETNLGGTTFSLDLLKQKIEEILAEAKSVKL